MEDNYLQFENPLRPLDWRAQLAAQLATAGRFPSPRLYDRAIRELVGLHEAKRRFGWSRNYGSGSNQRFLALSLAFDLRDTTDFRLRCAVEAMLLTELPFEEIAAGIGVEPPTVVAYTDAFFDVRDRLAAGQFIAQQVIDRDGKRGDRNWCDYGWKSVAYLGGAGALREVMAVDPAGDSGRRSASLRAATNAIVQEKLRRSIERLPDGELASLIKLTELGAEYERQTSENVPQGLLVGAEAILNSFSEAWRVGKPLGGPLTPFNGMAAELRAAEMMKVGRGEALDNLDELQSLGISKPSDDDAGRAGASEKSSAPSES